MGQWTLEGKREVEAAEISRIELEYYLVREDSEESVGETAYGIAIVKRDGEYTETEKTGGISYCEEEVRSILKLLIDGMVTPIGLLEIVDDLVSERLCS